MPTLVAANAPSGKPRTSTALRSWSAAERPIFHGRRGASLGAQDGRRRAADRRRRGSASRRRARRRRFRCRRSSALSETRLQPGGTPSTGCSSSVTAGHSATCSLVSSSVSPCLLAYAKAVPCWMPRACASRARCRRWRRTGTRRRRCCARRTNRARARTRATAATARQIFGVVTDAVLRRLALGVRRRGDHQGGHDHAEDEPHVAHLWRPFLVVFRVVFCAIRSARRFCCQQASS